MIEGVQNHSPEVMIIDEIGRPQEVRAARTCKERGVAMVGSAHGSFSSLLRNNDLKGLLGGLVAVTLGDKAAAENGGKKVRWIGDAWQLETGSGCCLPLLPPARTEQNNIAFPYSIPITKQVKVQREHQPIFDIVIELRRGQPNEWTTYRPVADIVDAIYDGKPYSVERRARELVDGGSKLYEWRVTSEELQTEQGPIEVGEGGLLV